MRALRFGSYSIVATLAGIPSLFRLKSMIRYCCLCPPPRCRDVLRPWLFRPPVRGLGASSDFSGESVVSSAKSETVWNRRPALVGLRERNAMGCPGLSVLEQVDRVTRGEGDDGPLGVGTVAHAAALPVALVLALAIQGVDVGDPHVEGLLDGVADVDLGGRRVDHEDVDVVVHQGVGLLRHDGTDEDVVRIPHDWFPSASSGRSTTSVSVTSVTSPSAPNTVSTWVSTTPTTSPSAATISSTSVSTPSVTRPDPSTVTSTSVSTISTTLPSSSST